MKAAILNGYNEVLVKIKNAGVNPLDNAIAKVPEYLSDEEAACVPLTALTALQA